MSALPSCDRMAEALGGKGFFVKDPKSLKGAVAEAMNQRGPALIHIVILEGAVRQAPMLHRNR